MFYCFRCDAMRTEGHSHVTGVTIKSRLKKEMIKGYSKDLLNREIKNKKEEKVLTYKWTTDPEKMGF